MSPASSCSDVKSEGIDTVICLDTSSSMAGQPITIALEAIHQLINGEKKLIKPTI